jgi:hypothetical protein
VCCVSENTVRVIIIGTPFFWGNHGQLLTEREQRLILIYRKKRFSLRQIGKKIRCRAIVGRFLQNPSGYGKKSVLVENHW